ncbi:peptidoglycan DD-metalloendopeptidase family protein [Candidatus Falkowbacteria bacterium]|nr:peptidoglycan DD-metalloendopeptidase family protein [Candidatus Falkowbacteria bacterium]
MAFLLSHKLVHLGVAALTLILVFANLTVGAQADVADLGGKTILAGLIESEFGDEEEEQLVEEFFDEEAIISPAQQSYLDNLTSIRSRPMAEIQTEEEEEREENIITPEGTALIKPDIISTKGKQHRDEVVYYTVQPSDTVSTIAEEFGISVNTILWENNLSAYSVIRPGDKLAILPTSGVTHKVVSGENLSNIAAKYNVSPEDIIEANKSADLSNLAVGQKLIIPGGKKSNYARYEPNRYSGLGILRDLIKPPSAIPPVGNKMFWPTVGYRVTQYFSWRHHAVDIANKIGTPIYAADAGMIEYVGWGKGYGNQIVIDHGGGKKTRYAHLAKFYAQKGQTVKKGQAIGAMGSTGWSTGSHLHFEIIIGGAKYNPLNYIK